MGSITFGAKDGHLNTCNSSSLRSCQLGRIRMWWWAPKSCSEASSAPPSAILPAKRMAAATRDVTSCDPSLACTFIKPDVLLEPSKEPRADIQALAGAFETVTGGLPLHLIYAFEMLTRPGGPLTADAVLRLPPNPTGDIRSYYRALWTSISATARTILHGLASIDFALPPSGLYQCFVSQSGAAEAIEEIDHLLDHRETGTFPFHGSVFVFVRGEQDHLSVARSLQPTMLAWLEGPAPAY